MTNKGVSSRHSLIHKHQRLLTFLGALIVFTTFVVKEGMREHLKSVVDSLELADSIFALREDNATNYSAILQVRGMVDSLSSQLKQRSLSTRSQDALNESLATLGLAIDLNLLVINRLARIQESTRHVRQLLGALPYDHDLYSKLKDYEGRLQFLSGKSEMLKAGMEMGMPAGVAYYNMSAEKHRKASSDVLDGIHDFQYDAENLEKAVNVLAEKALNTSEEYRESTEKSYKRYSIVSYILYAIGWTLGLVGRLSGIEVVAD